MDVQTLVDTVNKRTEKRAESKLDLRVEFFLGLDEFCLDRNFWWRRKRVLVQLAVDQALYDLSTNAKDFAQFDSVHLVDPSGTAICSQPLTPLFDVTAQLAATLNTTSATPSAFFLDTNASLKNIRLQAPSNVAQPLLASYWAMPQVPDPDSNTEDLPVPLVPDYLHWGLAYILERRVYEFLFGQNDPRFTVANANYVRFLATASRMPSWAVGQVQELRTRDSSLAVQAH